MNAPLVRFDDVLIPQAGARITFEVPEHCSVLVHGSESSGVDMLAELALALRVPEAGRVFVCGQELATLPPRVALARRRTVGYLPSGNGLLQNLTLRDNVALPLRFGSDLTDRAINGRLQVILAMLRIAEVAELRPAAATEEQRRRAALGRALAFDPLLLILADPFDGLPTRTAAELYEVARGGETEQGARRAVFMTAQYVPDRIEQRIDVRYRLAAGGLQREA